jgi:hypothetical protein
MADLFCWWQQDLTILPNGDLLTVEGTIEGEQRVLRRLLTNAGDYIWHLEYGAGLPKYVGSPVVPDEVNAVILSQMMLEDAVAQQPLPQVDTTPIANGISTDIKYVDADTGKPVTLGFDVNE